MITHDLSTAAHFADRIGVMYLGRIVEEGPAEEVVANPQHPYTQALISVVPKRDPREQTEPQILQGETPTRSTSRPAAGSTRAARSPKSDASRSTPSCTAPRGRTRTTTAPPASWFDRRSASRPAARSWPSAAAWARATCSAAPRRARPPAACACRCWPSSSTSRWSRSGAARRVLRQIDAARASRRTRRRAAVVTTRRGAGGGAGDGAVAGILALEGVEALGHEPALIATLHRLGVPDGRADVEPVERLRRRPGRGPGRRDHPLRQRAAGRDGAAGHRTRPVAPDAARLRGGARRASAAASAPRTPTPARWANPRNLDDDVLAEIGERGRRGRRQLHPGVPRPRRPDRARASRTMTTSRRRRRRPRPRSAPTSATGCAAAMRPAAGAGDPTPKRSWRAPRSPSRPRETFYADVLAGGATRARAPLAGATPCGSCGGVLRVTRARAAAAYAAGERSPIEVAAEPWSGSSGWTRA